MTVEKKINEIVNRLEKTKDERYPDLPAEKESRDSEERNEKKAQLQEQKRREKEEQKRKKEMEELRFVSSFQNKAKYHFPNLNMFIKGFRALCNVMEPTFT